MKQTQANPVVQTAGKRVNAKVTRIHPKVEPVNGRGVGTVMTHQEVVQAIARTTKRPMVTVEEYQAIATDDEQIHTSNVVSLVGLSPCEAADVITQLNARGKSADAPMDRHLALSWLAFALCDEIAHDMVIETVGHRRLANLMSEFMGY